MLLTQPTLVIGCFQIGDFILITRTDQKLNIVVLASSLTIWFQILRERNFVISIRPTFDLSYLIPPESHSNTIRRILW